MRTENRFKTPKLIQKLLKVAVTWSPVDQSENLDDQGENPALTNFAKVMLTQEGSGESEESEE